MNEILFGYFPYVALSVFLLGSLVRFDREQYTWKASSSQLLSGRRLRLGSNLFHVGILLLFFGHLFGLLTPAPLYHAFGLSAAAKQTIAMTAGGIFGTLCLIGMVILLHRRLTDDRVKAAGSSMDTFILVLLFIQLVLGLLTIPVSAGHPDGGTMLALAHWAQGIVTFQGASAAAYVAQVHWIYKLHLLGGLAMFLVFPFTRLVHVWSAPVWYLGRSYQIARRR